MNLQFKEIREDDVPSLTHVMRQAFDHDAQIHLGEERGGPDGYDNGEFFHKWLFSYDESHGYKILLDGQAVGGFIVWIFESRHNQLGTLFVDPDIQDQGIGTQAWKFIEATYPDTLCWELGTPDWAVKNHYFYEQKCGFEKVGEDPVVDREGVSRIYQKRMDGAQKLRGNPN